MAQLLGIRWFRKILNFMKDNISKITNNTNKITNQLEEVSHYNRTCYKFTYFNSVYPCEI